MTQTAAVVRDRRPPLALIRVLNPIMRTLLRTPLGRLVRPFALLEFDGRRSGRRYRVPVGWHAVGGDPVVFSPAPWRANFAGGTDVTVRLHGRRRRLVGTLVDDPGEVAAALDQMIKEGTPAARVGIVVPAGHQLTADDVRVVDRAMIRFAS